ncbi:MAG: diaminopimelate epimerase [Chitinophagales bacterium]|nr:MAG: diaminopimelate epimerase [Chitinophagales bacterium]
MKTIVFYKYQGNGNDFIVIDNRQQQVNGLSSDIIRSLCHRQFGIGADGLILMHASGEYDFIMQYFNSDGRESTMCGNGGRCIVRFAQHLALITDRARFLAVDGPHEAIIRKDGLIMLKMKDVAVVTLKGEDFVLDTGSPHYVRFAEHVHMLHVPDESRKIRNAEEFVKEGINVNFVEMQEGKLFVRTYERGVEDETLSCGTGVVAAALVSSIKSGSEAGRQNVAVETPGGYFEVSFLKKQDGGFSDIWLIGDARLVFKGEVEIPSSNPYPLKITT